MENREIRRTKKSTGVWDRDRYRKTEQAKSTEQTKKASGKSLEEMVDDLLRAIGFDIDPDDEEPFESSQEAKEKMYKVIEDRGNKRLLEELKHDIETDNMFNEVAEKHLQNMKDDGEDTVELEAAINSYTWFQKQKNDRLISELQLDERLKSELQLANINNFKHKMQSSKGQS